MDLRILGLVFLGHYCTGSLRIWCSCVAGAGSHQTTGEAFHCSGVFSLGSGSFRGKWWIGSVFLPVF